MKLFKSNFIKVSLFVLGFNLNLASQNIADFISVEPSVQTENFIFPSTHRFQKIIETGDALTEGGMLPLSPDFTGYSAILNSSTNGYLSINSERSIGNVTVLDINFNSMSKLWETTASEAIDFTLVAGTKSNCSGAITTWNTVISSEEDVDTIDTNNDLYNDFGWNVEIDPATKTVIGKLWAMGNFEHENVTIHANERTVYQGADSNPGYIYKFVADIPQDLTSGNLYVYKGEKVGSGEWILLQNNTPAECNSTLAQCAAVEATVFDGVEDLEIGPNGMVYVAVKNENRVYRFQDSDPITGTSAVMEEFVGNTSYDIVHNNGVTSTPWGTGNDNLAFDNLGNLWVFQDGGNNYIWVIGSNHTQTTPDVRVFGIAPLGAEPTGITFTPDYKYLFMSIMQPDVNNNANQLDAAGNPINFNKGTTLVLALEENLGTTLSLNEFKEANCFSIFPNPISNFELLTITGNSIHNLKLFSTTGKLFKELEINNRNQIELEISNLSAGTYFITLNNLKTYKILVKD